MGIEPTTYSLGSCRSTTELRPRSAAGSIAKSCGMRQECPSASGIGAGAGAGEPEPLTMPAGTGHLGTRAGVEGFFACRRRRAPPCRPGPESGVILFQVYDFRMTSTRSGMTGPSELRRLRAVVSAEEEQGR